ncbi:unnamed protein product [Caenorhabditis sp. 36 PRJEB53466]|nr:unnamed protein product [Caenorhabditis sp. 36 PRJEB53466]
MDLLDLELDLNVEGNSATGTSGPVTRRSQASRANKNTPATTTTTPKTAEAPKSAPKKTVAAAVKPPAAETPKNFSAVKAKATPKPALKKKKEVEPQPEEAQQKTPQAKAESPDNSASRGSFQRDSRSTSLEKRSRREKAKIRFSPSPETLSIKKRKTSRKPASSRVTSAAEFTEQLVELEQVLTQQGPVDFDLPEDWKSARPSDIVEGIIKKLTNGNELSTSSTSTVTNSNNNNNIQSSTTVPASNTIKKAAKSNNSARMPNASTPAHSQPLRVNRSFSKELGVDDFQEEPTSSSAGPRAKSPRKSVPSATRRSARKSAALEVEQPAPLAEETGKTPRKLALTRRSIKKQQDEAPEAVVDDPIVIRPKINEKPRRSTQRNAKKEHKQENPAPDAPDSAETVETPAQIPATSSASDSKSVVKTPISESSSARKSASTPSVLPTPRTSGRVSKPNRLYVDHAFNTEILGRTTITQQNPVKEAQAREKSQTPEPSLIAAPSTSTSRSVGKKPTTSTTPKVVVSKPVPIVNGVLKGYRPSVKVPLADIEVDGNVVKLDEIVTETMDTILLKVCQDGVEQHDNIDPKVVKAKIKVKIDMAKKVRLEAKKLETQMRIKIPAAQEELGKRKRQAPRNDDIYWTPPTHKGRREAPVPVSVSSIVRSYRKSATPFEEDSSSLSTPFLEPTVNEKRQQKARNDISNMFDAEMDAQIKEAKEYKISFEKYITPKITIAQQKSGIKLMSRKRQSQVPDDFYYHELLTDPLSPSNSNAENEGEAEVEIDVEGGVIHPEASISRENPDEITIRTDALDIAEQIAVLVPRPRLADGSEMDMEQIQLKAMEQPEQRRNTLQAAMVVIWDQLAHESAPQTGGSEEHGHEWHTITLANAQQMKRVYAVTDTGKEDSVIWTHKFFVENLPVHVLASYLSVVRYARRISPTIFGGVIDSTDQLNSNWEQVTNLLRSFVYKRGPEPGSEVLNETIPYYRMSDTVFLLVSPTMAFGDGFCSSQAAVTSRPRPHHGRLLFRWLQTIGHLDSETIGLGEEEMEATTSVAEYISDVIVETICEKVRQKIRERPECRIVLVGYGAATYSVHRAANLVGGIFAIISIGFPVMTKFGRRGTADDEILLTYCPTLFIVGAEGRHFNNEAITELRASMINQQTGLIVVGHSNDHLQVPSSVLVRLGINQTIVFRMVLEKILDFLNLDAVRQQNLADLVPIELNNVTDMDSALLKSDKALSGLAFATSPITSSAPSPVGSSGRRATVAGGEEQKRKRQEIPPPLQPQPPAQHQQYYTGPGTLPAPSPRADERFLAFQSLMASTVATADDMPRRASMGSSQRVVERGDFRERAAAIAAATSAAPRAPPPPPMSRGPVDPASISLI